MSGKITCSQAIDTWSRETGCTELRDDIRNTLGISTSRAILYPLLTTLIGAAIGLTIAHFTSHDLLLPTLIGAGGGLIVGGAYRINRLHKYSFKKLTGEEIAIFWNKLTSIRGFFGKGLGAKIILAGNISPPSSPKHAVDPYSRPYDSDDEDTSSTSLLLSSYPGRSPKDE